MPEIYGLKVAYESDVEQGLARTAASARRSLGSIFAQQKQVSQGFQQMDNSASGFGSSIKAALSGIALAGLAREVVTTTAKFEKYEATLANMTGSQAEAARIMNDLKMLAATTPFEVDQLTEAYIKLAGRGVKPSKAALTQIGDVAASLGKDMGQLTEAILDVNNTERWNELGIKAKTVGDKVRLSFRGQTMEVAKTEAGVLSAVQTFGRMDGVAGTMAGVSKTLFGQLSNLKDATMQTAAAFGQELRPAIEITIKALATGLKWMSDHRQGLVKIATVIGAAVLAYKTFQTVMAAARFAQLALNIAMMANPIGLVVAALAGLVAYLVLADGEFANMIKSLVGIRREVNALKGLPEGEGRMGEVRKRMIDAQTEYDTADLSTSIGRRQRKEALLKIKQLEEERRKVGMGNALSGLTAGQVTPEGKLSPLAKVTLGAGDGAGGAASDLATAVGDKVQTRNITFNIGNIVEEFNINTTTIQEGAASLRRLIAQELAGALADVELSAGN